MPASAQARRPGSLACGLVSSRLALHARARQPAGHRSRSSTRCTARAATPAPTLRRPTSSSSTTPPRRRLELHGQVASSTAPATGTGGRQRGTPLPDAALAADEHVPDPGAAAAGADGGAAPDARTPPSTRGHHAGRHGTGHPRATDHRSRSTRQRQIRHGRHPHGAVIDMVGYGDRHDRFEGAAPATATGRDDVASRDRLRRRHRQQRRRLLARCTQPPTNCDCDDDAAAGHAHRAPSPRSRAPTPATSSARAATSSRPRASSPRRTRPVASTASTSRPAAPAARPTPPGASDAIFVFGSGVATGDVPAIGDSVEVTARSASSAASPQITPASPAASPTLADPLDRGHRRWRRRRTRPPTPSREAHEGELLAPTGRLHGHQHVQHQPVRRDRSGRGRHAADRSRPRSATPGRGDAQPRSTPTTPPGRSRSTTAPSTNYLPATDRPGHPAALADPDPPGRGSAPTATLHAPVDAGLPQQRLEVPADQPGHRRRHRRVATFEDTRPRT